MSGPLFPTGERVELVARILADEPDADGNDVYTDETTPLSNVPVWPRGGGTELVQGQDTLITGLWALLPAGTDVSGIDAVRVRGLLYEVDGEPGVYGSPFTGLAPGVQVALTRITG